MDIPFIIFVILAIFAISLGIVWLAFIVGLGALLYGICR